MLRFVVRRLLQMCVVVLVLSMLVFAWLRSLPGGPVSAILGERQTPERRAALEAALGLDQPLPVQYLKFMERALQGNFGVSTKVLPGEDALDVFLTRLPATIELSVLALLLAIALGIPLGYLAARRARLGRRHDRGDLLAGRGGGAGVLHRLPAQVLLRRRVEPAAGLGAADHRPRRHPGDRACSSSTAS